MDFIFAVYYLQRHSCWNMYAQWKKHIPFAIGSIDTFRSLQLYIPHQWWNGRVFFLFDFLQGCPFVGLIGMSYCSTGYTLLCFDSRN